LPLIDIEGHIAVIEVMLLYAAIDARYFDIEYWLSTPLAITAIGAFIS